MSFKRSQNLLFQWTWFLYIDTRSHYHIYPIHLILLLFKWSIFVFRRSKLKILHIYTKAEAPVSKYKKIQYMLFYSLLHASEKSLPLCYQHEQNFHKDRHLLCSVKYKRSIYIVYTEMLAAPILKISVNRLVLERNGKKKRKTKSIQSTKEHV